MHKRIPELPEIIGLHGIWVWEVPFNEALKSWPVAKLRAQEPTQRFGRGQGANEGEKCPIVVQQGANTLQVDSVKVGCHMLYLVCHVHRMMVARECGGVNRRERMRRAGRRRRWRLGSGGRALALGMRT